jgi:hypothetical protein
LSRKRYPVELTALQTHKAIGPDFKHSDALAVLREFESLGAGKYVLGRKGRLSRFNWAVHPSETSAFLWPSPKD